MSRARFGPAALAALLFVACGEPPSAPPVDAGAPRTTCPEGDPCDDGNPCTEDDVCRSNRCVGTARRCEAPDECTLAAACDPATGQCRALTLAEGTTCDDGDACTTQDACREGRCRGEPVVCDGPTTCTMQGMCDPTTGQCTGQVPVQDGVPCDDQVVCTTMDMCQGGVCSGVAAPAGTSCDDGDLCTTADTCVAGVCTSTTATCLASEDPCVADAVCDPASGACAYPPAPDGTVCDDVNVCTSSSACSAGQCVGTATVTCAPRAQCEVAVACDPMMGCQFADAPDGASCDDGNACTSTDTCMLGVCAPGERVRCGAPTDCQLEAYCDPAMGCVFPPVADGSRCSDGDACTVIDRCVNGSCVGMDPVVCPAPEACELPGQCDPATGQCTRPVQPDGAMCSDGSVCTQMDMCAAGMCVSGPTTPFTGQPCQDGVCFTDTTTLAGLTFTSTRGGLYMGAGGGFVDVDGDALPDIVFATEGGGTALYRNLGGGRFADISATAGLPAFSFPDALMGVAAADHDGDGDQDLYFVARGANVLMANDGTGRFTDVTATASVGDPRWSTGAAFADFDQDGDLDLYVGNYIQVPRFPNHTPWRNTLYRNNSDGTYTDVTATAQVGGAGTTLAVSWSDYDQDGDLDLLVCNDFGAFVEPNQLYRNDGQGRFTEVSQALGFDAGIYCMGITAGDWDRDGDLDYYFSNLGRNVFLENTGANGFLDRTSSTRTDLTRDRCFTGLLTTSWGVGFHDFDADGWLDLYVSNGYVPAEANIANARNSENALLRHDGAGLGFRDITQSAGATNGQIGRGAAFADYDRDGDVDVLQINWDGRPTLLRNDSPAAGAYLKVDARGRVGHPDAIGLQVTVREGGRAHLRELNPNYSYESTSEPTLVFGLGAATQVDATARWPSGITQRAYGVPTNGALTLVEPLGTIATATVTGLTAGTDATVTLVLHHHRLTSTRIDVDAQLTTSSTGASANAALDLTGTATVTLSLPVPGTAAGSAQVRITARDAGGGVDEAQLSTTVTP